MNETNSQVKASEIKIGDITSFGKITKIEKYKRKNWIKFTYISKCDNDSKIEFTTSSPKTDWIKIWKLQVEIN
mgnify:CR=1 FL=1